MKPLRARRAPHPRRLTHQPPTLTAVFLAGQRCWAGRGNPNAAPMKGALCVREGAALLLLLPPRPRGHFPAWSWPHRGRQRETKARGSPMASCPTQLPQRFFSSTYTPALVQPHAAGEPGPGDMLSSLMGAPAGAIPAESLGRVLLARAGQVSRSGEGAVETEGHSLHLHALSSALPQFPFPSLASSVAAAPLTPDRPRGLRPAHTGACSCPCRGGWGPLARGHIAAPSLLHIPGQKLAGASLPCHSGRCAGRRVAVGSAPRVGAGRWLPCPGRAAAGGGGGSRRAWTGRRMNSITGSRFYSTCQGARD